MSDFQFNWGGGGGGGGRTLSKCSKTLYYKNLLETYFVKTCRLISTCNIRALVMSA